MIRILFSLIALFGVVADADACQRCGIFGRGCRMQQSTYYKPTYYQPVAAVVQQPSVFVVQNSYPAPLAIQGSTQYGYQAASAIYSVNPAEVLRQAAALSQAATVTAQLGLTGFNQTAQTQLQLQASITEPLARGQAAAQVLSAAGLSQPFTQQQAQSVALRVYTENGQMRVEQVTAPQVNARIEASVGNGQAPQPTQSRDPPPIPGPERSTVVAQKCAKCHGLNLTEPKGGVFFDAGHGISCDTFREAMLRMSSTDPKVRMPPDGNLTPQEAGDILQELLVLSKPRT